VVVAAAAAMTTILITGASGLVGQAVSARLRGSGQHIAAVVRRRPPGPAAGADFVITDLADPDFVAMLPRRADAVIHLAQAERYGDFPEAAQEIMAVNVVALTRLLDWARTAGVRSFVHASTGGLYGRGARPLRETDPLHVEGPLSFYFRSKQCAELLAAEYARFFRVIALRPFFVYGGGQRPHMLMPRLVASIRDGRPVRLAGADGMRFNPVHVSDMVTAIEACLAPRDGENAEVFNIAGPEILSIRDIAEALGAAVGRAPVYEMAPMPTDAADIIGDTTRLRERGWTPRVRFRDAAPELCEAWAETRDS
jgi:UDP-glucose 4-epimerase